MKREIVKLKCGVSGCCPGHDIYPTGTYNNRRSKKARARDKKAEHQHVRTIIRQQVKDQITETFDQDTNNVGIS